MKEATELLNEAIQERKVIEDKAFEAFCKEELLCLADIITKNKKDLESAEKRMQSYTIEKLKEMFGYHNVCMQNTNKEIWMTKVRLNEVG